MEKRGLVVLLDRLVYPATCHHWVSSACPENRRVDKPAKAFPKGWSTLGTTIGLLIAMGVLTYIAGIFMKFDLKRYIPGFIVIFVISFISMVISKQAFFKKWGISYVLFALLIGLIISNIFKVPKFLKAAGQTEFFVKIGLVCMGATIMFSVVLKAGAMGVAQAILVATVVWFMVASMIVSFLVEPGMGSKAAKGAAKLCKSYRSWFFTLCFVSIGMETNFKKLVTVGGGRPALAY
jgi:uncharacterized membrane protein YadS